MGGWRCRSSCYDKVSDVFSWVAWCYTQSNVDGEQITLSGEEVEEVEEGGRMEEEVNGPA